MIYIYILILFFVVAAITMAFDEVSFKDFLKGFFNIKELIKRVKYTLFSIILLADMLGSILFRGKLEFISTFLYIKTTFREHSKAWIYARKVVDWVALNIFKDANHCEKSFYGERERAKQSIELGLSDEELGKLKSKYSD